jgi:hypothetical protein
MAIELYKRHPQKLQIITEVEMSVSIVEISIEAIGGSKRSKFTVH